MRDNTHRAASSTVMENELLHTLRGAIGCFDTDRPVLYEYGMIADSGIEKGASLSITVRLLPTGEVEYSFVSSKSRYQAFQTFPALADNVRCGILVRSEPKCVGCVVTEFIVSFIHMLDGYTEKGLPPTIRLSEMLGDSKESERLRGLEYLLENGVISLTGVGSGDYKIMLHTKDSLIYEVSMMQEDHDYPVFSERQYCPSCMNKGAMT